MTIVVNMNQLIMESSIENQVTYLLQNSANNAVLVIEDEIKDINEFLSMSDSAISFVSSDLDTVGLAKSKEYLEKTTSYYGNASRDTLELYLKLNRLEFDTTSIGNNNSILLDISVETVNSSHESTSQDQKYYAYASRSVFLRNMKVASEINENVPAIEEEAVDDEDNRSFWDKIKDWFSFW